jgi:hypothetical protein
MIWFSLERNRAIRAAPEAGGGSKWAAYTKSQWTVFFVLWLPLNLAGGWRRPVTTPGLRDEVTIAVLPQGTFCALQI